MGCWWVTSRSGWLLELLTELIKYINIYHTVHFFSRTLLGQLGLVSLLCSPSLFRNILHIIFDMIPGLISRFVNVSENFLFLHLLADSQRMVLCTTNFESANFGRGLNCKYMFWEIRIYDLNSLLNSFLDLIMSFFFA